MFCLIIGCVFLFNLLTPDQALSYSERRTLQQMPQIDGEFLLSGTAQKDLEAYMLDQFAFRDTFRMVKAVTDMKILREKDNNGIYVIGDQVFKMEYPLKEQSVLNLAEKLTEIYDLYLSQCRVAVAVIPDKAVYRPEEKGYLGYDYYDMTGLLNGALDPEKFTWMDLKNELTLQDYYGTDLHWRQEGLGRVLAAIGNEFHVDFPGASLGRSPEDWKEAGYEAKAYSPFYGAYFGQAALPKLKPDTLFYFTNSQIDGLQVENMDSQVKPEDQVVYNEKKLGSIDSYELFLSGNSPLVVLTNPQAKSDRELVVFRDSYGSSIAPLLAEGYRKVTLIDLRFVGYSNIGQFVDFTDQDVLFLYSAGLVNSSDMVRKQ